MNAKSLFFTLALGMIIPVTNAQTLEWVKGIGGIGADVGNFVTVDASGNIYTTGYFQNAVNFGAGSDFDFISAGSLDIFISKLDASGNLVWARQIGGTGWDAGYSIAVDAAGNVYTTGGFAGTVDFDPGVDTFMLSSAGSNDVFISKLDASGHFVWAKQLGGISSDTGYAIALDATGNVYTTGEFANTADFDPGASVFNFSSAGNRDIFISKLDTSGHFIWAKQIGGIKFEIATSISVDALGNVYTTGIFGDTVDFDPGAGVFDLNSSANSTIFISKLDASGHFIWAKKMGSILNSGGYSIVVDALGNVYTAGDFEGTVDFDPGVDTFMLSSAGSIDIFISKLDASGHFVWAKQIGGVRFDKANSISVDALGNVYTTGYFAGTVDFDPGDNTFNLISTGGNPDIFISKLDATGSFVWAKKMGFLGSDRGYSIVVDVSGDIYTTGHFTGTVDFDPGENIFNLTSAGSLDIFIHKMSQTTTGLSVNFLEKEFIAYPNPTSGQINILFHENSSQANVVVRNYMGQEVFRKFFEPTNIIELTIEGEPGFYVLEITKNGKKAILKFIKH